MNLELNNLDPDWAWSPFEPTPENPWNARLVAHLYRRAGIAANGRQIQRALELEPEALVDQLIQGNVEAAKQSANTVDSLISAVLATGDSRQLSAAWVYRLLNTDHQLLERCTLFWHSHFATSAEKVENVKLMWQQNQLLRRHALGQFGALVQGIASDPAMLVYLDSTTNRKSHPNENFAREVMELFCLGEGNYSERDVQELARCFTGWEVRRNRFHKNPYQQDRQEKQILGQAGPFDGEDGLAIVLDQPSLAPFVCGKLTQLLVFDEPACPLRLLKPLAGLFREHELKIAPIVRRILCSNLFFSEHSVGRKIRSPVDLLCGLLRVLDGQTNTIRLAAGLEQIGLGLFRPPNVKGWEGGRTWINSSTLLGRANLVQQVLNDESTRFGKGNLAEFFSSQDVDSPSKTLQWLEDHLLAVPLRAERRELLTKQLQIPGNDQDRRLRSMLHALATLPEFQLG